jgi:2-polyprenyl-3-methyl-5-hydroxy-6-metoxy-1,4-benzoquinol methylase
MVWFLPSSYSTVIDIGCGEGIFFNNLKAKCEVWGVEPNKIAANLASKRMQNILIGKYSEVASQIPERYFDLVICNDVIEHLEDVDGFLNSIKKKMKDGAFLVGSVPNVRFFGNLIGLLISRDWEYRESGILDKDHLRFFTERSLRRSLERHGFVVDLFKGITKQEFYKFSSKGLIKSLLINGAIAITLGSYSDIRYLQFGFRARKK